jgi:predicted Holliday junction resolvase-like endonuclease
MDMILFFAVCVIITVFLSVYEKLTSPFRKSKEEEMRNLNNQLKKESERNRELEAKINSGKSEEQKKIDELNKRYPRTR